MTVSITEADGTKRTMQGAIQQISINMKEHTLSMQVLGFRNAQCFTIKNTVTITERD